MRSTLMYRLGCVAVAVVALSLPTRADIIGTGGDVVLIEPPPSVQLGDLESSTEVIAFNELQGVLLSTDIPVDASEPGVYANLYDLTPATISAGTVVSSHFLHLDPVGDGPAFLNGWITFDQDILGVIALDSSLDATDGLLSWPDTLYPAPAEGLEFDAETRDAFAIEGNMRTLWVTFAAGTNLDHIRVVTVPEPACVALLGIGSLWVLRRRPWQS